MCELCLLFGLCLVVVIHRKRPFIIKQCLYASNMYNGKFWGNLRWHLGKWGTLIGEIRRVYLTTVLIAFQRIVKNQPGKEFMCVQISKQIDCHAHFLIAINHSYDWVVRIVTSVKLSQGEKISEFQSICCTLN